MKPPITLEQLVSLLPANLDEAPTAVIQTYWALRIVRGERLADIIDEPAGNAWLNISVHVGGFDPSYRNRPSTGYEPSDRANMAMMALRAFYDTMRATGIRTAGDPFAALDWIEPDPWHRTRTLLGQENGA